MRISDWSSDVCSSDLFGLIDLEDDPVGFNDEADGTITLTFRTETDGGEGSSVTTWEGGFEDWQPDQDGCDPAEFPMQVIIGFTPADNEEIVSFTLFGIPEGAQLLVGGVLVDTTGGTPPLLPPDRQSAVQGERVSG